MKWMSSKEALSPPSSEIGLGTVMMELLEVRGYARSLSARAVQVGDQAGVIESEAIMKRIGPIIIRLMQLGGIEEFQLTEEERRDVHAAINK